MRKFLFFVLFIVIGLSYLFEVDKLIARNFNFLTTIKLSYINTVIDISNTIDKYFNQVKTIEELKKENAQLKQYEVLYNTTLKKFDSLNEYVNTASRNNTSSTITQTKVLSYIGFNDFTKVWVDYEKKDDSILGLITGEYAAGIVLKEDDKSIALLNGNKKSSYAVFIGEKKIPGIVTSAKGEENLLIKFIPIWSDIKEGDEVITSGMDNIFFEGLKVGKVLKVTKLSDMKTALIKPYANVLKKKYFYVYKAKNEIKELEKKEDKETTNK